MIRLEGSLNFPKTCAFHSERFLLPARMNNEGVIRPAADARINAVIRFFIPWVLLTTSDPPFFVMQEVKGLFHLPNMQFSAVSSKFQTF